MINDTQHKQEIMTELAKSLSLSGERYMESIRFLLKERKELLGDIENNYRKINILTCCTVVMFFSYTENTAILIKHILKELDDSIISKFSRGKQELISKNDGNLSFEDVMKITFSVLPHLFGEENHYGKIKDQNLATLHLLREMRNTIIHPTGIQDLFVPLDKLEGKDINAPIIAYITAVKDVVSICARNSSD